MFGRSGRRRRQHGPERRIGRDRDMSGRARDPLGSRRFPAGIRSAGRGLAARPDGNGVCEREELAHTCTRDRAENGAHNVDAREDFLGLRLRAVRRGPIDGVEQVVARSGELIGGSKIRPERGLRCREGRTRFRHRAPADVVTGQGGCEMGRDVREMARDRDGGIRTRRARRPGLRHGRTPERERQEHHYEQAGHRSMIANRVPKDKRIPSGGDNGSKEDHPEVVFPTVAP